MLLPISLGQALHGGDDNDFDEDCANKLMSSVRIAGSQFN